MSKLIIALKLLDRKVTTRVELNESNNAPTVSPYDQQFY